MKTHEERVALLTRAFPKHPRLALRALRYMNRDKARYEGQIRAYSALLVHAYAGMSPLEEWCRRTGEPLDAFVTRKEELLVQAAEKLKGVPVDGSQDPKRCANCSGPHRVGS